MKQKTEDRVVARDSNTAMGAWGGSRECNVVIEENFDQLAASSCSLIRCGCWVGLCCVVVCWGVWWDRSSSCSNNSNNSTSSNRSSCSCSSSSIEVNRDVEIFLSQGKVSCLATLIGYL